MTSFEGLRFRRPGKRDPTSCLAHHPRSFDPAQCPPRRPHPSRRRRAGASRRLGSCPSRHPPARPLRRQPRSRRPHLRPSWRQRLRQATRRHSPKCADRSRGRSWVASYYGSQPIGAPSGPARTREQQRGCPWVGEGGAGRRGVFPSVGRRHAGGLGTASRVVAVGTAPHSQQEKTRSKKCIAYVD